MDVEEWLQTNGGLLHKAAKPYMNRGVEYEDIMQEANIAAMLAIRKYDESRQWSLSSFVYFCIQRHLRDVINKAKPNLSVTSLDEINDENIAYQKYVNDMSPVETEVEHHELARSVMAFGERRECAIEKDVIHAIVSGEGKVSDEISRIAKKHNTALRSVWYRKRKLQNALAEELSDWHIPNTAAI